MRQLTIRGIDKKFILEPGKIYNINIENINYYHYLVLSLFNEDIETFIYSNDLKLIDFNKESLFISDLYSCSINSKKILNSLYKRIIESLPSSIKEEELIDINSSILEILKKIELDLDVPIDYETDLDLSSIFSLYKLSFKEDYNSNIEKLITFIKANIEIKKVYLVITLNTLPLFNENEQNLLKKELELMGVSLVNINLCVRNKTLSVEYITIDNDLCQF